MSARRRHDELMNALVVIAESLNRIERVAILTAEQEARREWDEQDDAPETGGER